MQINKKSSVHKSSAAMKHGAAIVRRNLLNVLLLGFLVLGGSYLYRHGTIPSSVKTTLLPIIYGVSIFVVGQAVQKGVIEPLQALQQTIGEIASAVVVYGNTAGTSLDTEVLKEARQVLRKLSGDLLGKKRAIPFYRFFQSWAVLPPKENIAKAAKGLILMSNSVASQNLAAFEEGRKRVIDALWLYDMIE